MEEASRKKEAGGRRLEAGGRRTRTRITDPGNVST